eukprot:4046687-Amphidinium_carterae.3
MCIDKVEGYLVKVYGGVVNAWVNVFFVDDLDMITFGNKCGKSASALRSLGCVEDMVNAPDSAITLSGCGDAESLMVRQLYVMKLSVVMLLCAAQC